MGAMTILAGIPQAIHRGEDELPFVDLGDGSTLQLLQVDIDAGLWVIRNKFAPGMTVQRHKHTGPVFAFTQSGAWKYAEYPEVNRAGSYLYEPAGSTHTLQIAPDAGGPTEIFFVIYGALVNFDEKSTITGVLDAAAALAAFSAMPEAHRPGAAPIIVGGRAGYSR